MLTAALIVALFALVVIMVTLGAVLLMRFALGAQSHARRVFAAAMGGPLTMAVPIFAVVYSEQGGFEAEQFVAMGIVLAIGAGIGWLAAHLATRRLDRLTQFDLQVFE